MQHDFRPVILFLSAILFCIGYSLALEPRWVLGGEMWDEMATNYFPNAKAPSYITKLFSTDAGYISLFPRLLALIANQFSLPAASVPYFYTWSAIICTGIIVGSFCLRPFRALVSSDALRFLIVVCIVMTADFQTRLFINFTYFSAFFVTIVTALALIKRSVEIPRWAWCIPILMVSKPAVLAALPAMICVALVSQPRFRRITLVTVALCVGQIIRIAISAKTGEAPYDNNTITFFATTITSLQYFFGFLGGCIIGPKFYMTKCFLLPIGVYIFYISGWVIVKKKHNAGALVVTGLSLLFFTVLLNCCALSKSWNRNLVMLDSLWIDRHNIVGFFGCILVISGLLAAQTEQYVSTSSNLLKKNLGAILFCIWFIGSGWFSYAVNISKEPLLPIMDHSQWQNMAFAIDSGVSPLCVPVDPWWSNISRMYQRNCRVLTTPPNWKQGKILINNPLFLDITPPATLYEKTLLAAGVLVKPFSVKKTFIAARMKITLRDGKITYYMGAQNINPSGGLLLLTGKEGLAVKNIVAIRLTTNVPVEISLAAGNPPGVPGIAWMGNG